MNRLNVAAFLLSLAFVLLLDQRAANVEAHLRPQIAPRPPVTVVAPEPTPAPTERVTPVLVGIASTYGPGYKGLTAVPMREWRGKHIEVCYETRCVVRVVNDLGPDQRVYPGRVVDLDMDTFEYLAQGSWRIGLLYDVTVTLLDE